MGVTEIAREVGIHKSKAYSILTTLNHFGFVDKDPQAKTYSLGMELLSLARHVLDNLRYPEVVSPLLQELATETNSTALFGLIQGDSVVVLDKYEKSQNIGFTVRVGHRFHITLGAHGKIIVAFLPEAEQEKILSKKKVHFSLDSSRVNMKLLREELRQSREVGYARDIGGITPGVNVVSAPLFDNRNRLIGCLILIGTFPEKRIEEYGSKVAGMAHKISQRLGADVEAIYHKQV
jgi:DNA-binding IclR family transcriptional regulator